VIPLATRTTGTALARALDRLSTWPSRSLVTIGLMNPAKCAAHVEKYSSYRQIVAEW
jgi:hypothetical protein